MCKEWIKSDFWLNIHINNARIHEISSLRIKLKFTKNFRMEHFFYFQNKVKENIYIKSVRMNNYEGMKVDHRILIVEIPEKSSNHYDASKFFLKISMIA